MRERVTCRPTHAHKILFYLVKFALIRGIFAHESRHKKRPYDLLRLKPPTKMQSHKITMDRGGVAKKYCGPLQKPGYQL